ncbi:MAG: sulfatase, partial [Armatimonadetes bacterium]|nr:sulfatase [Armatimonadota bacterium]
MDPRREHELLLTRRQLFGKAATGIGVAALASLLNPKAFAEGAASDHLGILGGQLHHAPKAK